MEFSDSLTELMAAKGVSQNELARRSGMKSGSVNKYCQGQRSPGLDVVLKFAEALEVTPNELLGANLSSTYTTSPISRFFFPRY